MFFACKQNNKTVENATICDEPNFDNYTFCEQYATAEEKAWEAKAVGLMQQIHLLFEAIKCSDIASADLYASKYGLGTLLYLNLKTIDTYKVLSYQISDKTATVHIKFNNKKTTTSCIFKQENEQPNTWFFHGINIYEAFSESGTKSRYGHKVKTQNVLP
ncbi:MAG: hypothetical protein ACPG5B_00865 [Chitinophagales bacterium]